MSQNLSRQYLSFSLEEELYAIPISKVREVLEFTKITKLPKSANFMKGLINLRGIGVPVIDLRLKFGLSESPITKDTAIIVLDVDSQDGYVFVGALADMVHEVVEIQDDKVEATPRFGFKLAEEFIQGVGKIADNFIIILDIDKVLNHSELSELKEQKLPSLHE